MMLDAIANPSSLRKKKRFRTTTTTAAEKKTVRQPKTIPKVIVVQYPKKSKILYCCLAFLILESYYQILFSATTLPSAASSLFLQYPTTFSYFTQNNIYNQHYQNSCANTIGNDGHWVQDWTYAREYGQYSEPRPSPQGPYEKQTWGIFQPSNETPFIWPSSFRWVDSNSKNCQINHTIISSCHQTCNLLHTLNVDRILFYGDSLTKSQYTSFVNFLGYDCVREMEEKNKPALPQQQVELVCPHSNRIIGIRLSRGEAGKDPNPPTQRIPRVNITLSNETRDFMQYPYNNDNSNNNYNNSTLDDESSVMSSTADKSNTNNTKTTRLLAIFNLGVHYHTFPGFQNDMDILLDWIEEFAHPNDLIFFRPSPSGHTQCYTRKILTVEFIEGLQGVYPFDSLEEFIPTEKYFWHLLPQFNQYVADKIQLEQQQQKRTVSIRILNVVNMTLLRRDGHMAKKDCLHYILPGPPDWWNHLLMTELLEVGKVEEQEKIIAGNVEVS